jgi:hypothetical protein
MADKIPEEVLYGNEAIAALQGVSNIVPGCLYWTIKGMGSGVTPPQAFPANLPGGGNIRAFCLDPSQMLAAIVDDVFTNLSKSFEIPQNYKAFVIDGLSVDHWLYIKDDTTHLQPIWLRDVASFGSANLRVNEKSIYKLPMSHVQTAHGIYGVAFDRTATTDTVLAQMNEGRPAGIVRWPDDTVIFMPKSKAFDVLLHYLPAFMTVDLGTNIWFIRVALWGKAILQVD